MRSLRMLPCVASVVAMSVSAPAAEAPRLETQPLVRIASVDKACQALRERAGWTSLGRAPGFTSAVVRMSMPDGDASGRVDVLSTARRGAQLVLVLGVLEDLAVRPALVVCDQAAGWCAEPIPLPTTQSESESSQKGRKSGRTEGARSDPSVLPPVRPSVDLVLPFQRPRN